MSTWIRRLAASFGAGVLISLAIAWVSGARTSTAFDHVPLGDPDPRTGWFGGRATRPAATYVWRSSMWMSWSHWLGDASVTEHPAEGARAPAWSRMSRRVTDAERRPVTAFAELEQASGWPWPCLVAYRQKRIDHGQATWVDTGSSGGVEIGEQTWTSGPPPIVPMRPLPLGLLADGVVNGGLAALLVVVPVGVRRLVRRRRGACPRCGYDLRGAAAPRCPECGRAGR